MESMPMGYAGLIAMFVPFLTAKVKAIVPNEWRALTAPVLGAVSSVGIALLGGYDIPTALAIGVGAGGVGSSARDLTRDVFVKKKK